MKSLIVLTLIFATSYASAENPVRCRSFDQRNIDRLYADIEPKPKPVEARDFGLEIQKRLRSNDTESFIQLIKGPLVSGSIEKIKRAKDLHSAFHPSFLGFILEDVPRCSPPFTDGFEIGKGAIWYQYIDGEFTIISIPGLKVIL